MSLPKLTKRKKLIVLGLLFLLSLFLVVALTGFLLWRYQRYGLGMKEVVSEVWLKREPVAKVAAEKNFSWQPTEISSYLLAGEQTQKVFMVLAELVEKGGNLWTVKPADGKKLEVALSSQTKFYQRQPVLTEDRFGWGEKSTEISREDFQIGEVVMVEWVNGVWEGGEKRRVIALTVSKR